MSIIQKRCNTKPVVCESVDTEDLYEFILFDSKSTQKKYLGLLQDLIPEISEETRACFAITMESDFKKAFVEKTIKHEMYYNQEVVSFPTSYHSESGEVVYACCDKNIDPTGKPWILRHFKYGGELSTKISGEPYRRCFERLIFVRDKDTLVQDVMTYVSNNTATLRNPQQIIDDIYKIFDDERVLSVADDCNIAGFDCKRVKLPLELDDGDAEIYLYLVKNPLQEIKDSVQPWMYFSIGDKENPVYLPTDSLVAEILTDPYAKQKKTYPRIKPYEIEPAHGLGRFGDQFIYVYLDKLKTKFEEIYDLSELFPEINDEQLYKYVLYNCIAEKYTTLSPDDFIYGHNPESVIFPSGFIYPDGDDIMIYATENQNPDKQKWYFHHLRKKDEFDIYGIVRGSKYIIANEIKTASGTLDNTYTIISNIGRYVSSYSSLIWLIDGKDSESFDPKAELYVPTHYFKADDPDRELYLLCNYKNGYEGNGWYFRSVTYEGAPLETYLWKDRIFHWAKIVSNENNPNEPYEKLAKKAEDEVWALTENDPYGVLKSYLRNTFSYLYNNYLKGNNDNGTISFSNNNNEKWATFNTGLLDKRTHKFIYAIFRKECDTIDLSGYNKLYLIPKYKLYGYYTKVDRDSNFVLEKEITNIPMPARYFHDRKDTVWNLSWDKTGEIQVPATPVEHILDDRGGRLPLAFYKVATLYSSTMKDILENNDLSDRAKYSMIHDFLQKSRDGDPVAIKVFQILQRDLEAAVHDAFTRLAINWRSVIPSYNPRRDEPCFIIPVSFPYSDRVEVALVATPYDNKPYDNKTYKIHTLLPLPRAYVDARLVCKPEAGWLDLNAMRLDTDDDVIEEDIEDDSEF